MMDTTRWAAGLDPEQMQAVTFDGDGLLIVAGAGTGKTRTLVARLARLIEGGVAPDRILLVTSFNLSAVRGTKATLLLLEALGVDMDGVDVVLNHTRPRENYRREDIETILGRSILVDLPYDPRVDPSLDSGTPIVLAQPRAELARRLTALSQLIAVPAATPDNSAAEMPAPVPPTYRRRFSLGRR